MSVDPVGKPLDVFIVVGEHSGDQLGFKLMQALRRDMGGNVTFRGVGGELMVEQGFESLFPLADIAVMGFSAVFARLPTILRRLRQTVGAIVARPPGILVIIDSPDFTHRVAQRARRVLPSLPVVDYVSPTVWAWRPGRARKMRRYVDHLLALLPFEPEAHERLGGPPCTYVGHPLIERLVDLRPNADEQRRREAEPPLVLVLPGSRRLEIRRLMPDLGLAVERIAATLGDVEFVLPAVSHLRGEIEHALASWKVRPRIVAGETEKWATFRTARAALAASGTVTLELALAGVPMVVVYRVSKLEEQLKYFVHVPSIVLPNLILGENSIREFLQHDCEPAKLAAAMIPLIRGGIERDRQVTALQRLDSLMHLPQGEAPSDLAARIVLATAEQAQRRSRHHAAC
jgi:lipid-A-disaccharide synthase